MGKAELVAMGPVSLADYRDAPDRKYSADLISLVYAVADLHRRAEELGMPSVARYLALAVSELAGRLDGPAAELGAAEPG